MEDEPVVGDMNFIFRDIFQELQFCLERGFCIGGEAQAFGNAEHVCVYRHIGLLVNNAGDNVGGFAPYPGEFNEFGHGGWDFAVEIIHDHIGHADEVFRFVVGIADTPDEGKELIEGGLTECRDVRILLEYGGSGEINPLIGTLGRQDYGNQQLIRIVVKQFCFCIGRMVFKVIDYVLESFFFRHARKIIKLAVFSSVLRVIEDGGK